MNSKKLAIRSKVSLHDRSQVEIAFSYLFTDGIKSGLNKKNSRVLGPYEVDAYFFFPTQMRVEPDSYPKEKFYQDLKSFVRLREPRLSYKRLIGIGIQPSVSPIVFVRRKLEQLSIEHDIGNIELMIDEIRLFACSFSSYVFRRSHRHKRKIQKYCRNFTSTAFEQTPEAAKRIIFSIEKFSQKGFHLIHAWRELISQASKLSGDVANRVKQELSYVDEYVSYAFRDALMLLLKEFDTFLFLQSSPEYKRLRRRLLAALRLERWYSRKQGFFWVEANSTGEYQERYVSRRSALKRRVWSVLYLDARTKPLFTIQRQTGAIISAGLAGAWAVMAEIIIRQRGFVPGGVGISNLGVSGFLLITALIMAYILKDRIKELGRSYFQFRSLFRIPDNSNVINFKDASGVDRQVALVKEEVSFVKKKKLPSDIALLKQKKSEEHIDPDELYKNVLHYKKSIHLDKDVMSNLPQPIKALHDILRLSISSYLARLDDSLHQSLVLDDKEEVVEKTMPKIYHLDIVLKYSRKLQKGEIAKPVYDYVRLFINKEGLVRIRQISIEENFMVSLN